MGTFFGQTIGAYHVLSHGSELYFDLHPRVTTPPPQETMLIQSNIMLLVKIVQAEREDWEKFPRVSVRLRTQSSKPERDIAPFHAPSRQCVGNFTRS